MFEQNNLTKVQKSKVGITTHYYKNIYRFLAAIFTLIFSQEICRGFELWVQYCCFDLHLEFGYLQTSEK